MSRRFSPIHVKTKRPLDVLFRTGGPSKKFKRNQPCNGGFEILPKEILDFVFKDFGPIKFSGGCFFDGKYAMRDWNYDFFRLSLVSTFFRNFTLKSVDALEIDVGRHIYKISFEMMNFLPKFPNLQRLTFDFAMDGDLCEYYASHVHGKMEHLACLKVKNGSALETKFGSTAKYDRALFSVLRRGRTKLLENSEKIGLKELAIGYWWRTGDHETLPSLTTLDTLTLKNIEMETRRELVRLPPNLKKLTFMFERNEYISTTCTFAPNDAPLLEDLTICRWTAKHLLRTEGTGFYLKGYEECCDDSSYEYSESLEELRSTGSGSSCDEREKIMDISTWIPSSWNMEEERAAELYPHLRKITLKRHPHEKTGDFCNEFVENEEDRGRCTNPIIYIEARRRAEEGEWGKGGFVYSCAIEWNPVRMEISWSSGHEGENSDCDEEKRFHGSSKSNEKPFSKERRVFVKEWITEEKNELETRGEILKKLKDYRRCISDAMNSGHSKQMYDWCYSSDLFPQVHSELECKLEAINNWRSWLKRSK